MMNIATASTFNPLWTVWRRWNMARRRVDNYMDAIGPRARSVRVLIRNDRRTAAQHLGGMTIECIVKSGIVLTTGITHWDDSATPGSIRNPMHDLNRAFRLLPNTIQTIMLTYTAFQPSLDLI